MRIHSAATLAISTGLLVAGSAAAAQAPDDSHARVGQPPAGGFLEHLPDALDLAEHEGRPIFVHFTAPWCQACKEMKERVYPEPRVRKRLARFVRVRVDVETRPGKKAWEEFRVSGLPTLAFLRADGSEEKALRLTGLQEPEALAEALDDAIERLDVPAAPGRERAIGSGGDGIPGPGNEVDGSGPGPSDRAPAAPEEEARDAGWIWTVLGGLALLALAFGAYATRSRSSGSS